MASNSVPARTKVASVDVDSIADLLPVNGSRVEAFFYNESSESLRVIAGTGGGADDYTYVIAPGGTWSVSGHAAGAAWRGYWTSVDGQARVTEWK